MNWEEERNNKRSEQGRKRVRIAVAGIILLIVFVALISSIRIVDQTEVGVVQVLGEVRDTELTAGLNFVLPFITSVTYMPVYEATMTFHKENGQQITAQTNEGVTVAYDLAVQWSTDPQRASEVYTKLRNPEVWMMNRIRSTARDITAKYTTEDFYGAKRTEIQQEILNQLEPLMETNGLQIRAVLIREVNLPDRIVQRIEEKIQAQQEANRMEFVLQREEQEAERKVIEAEGIANANEIIANSLDEAYLQWYWIQNLDKHESVAYVPIGNQGFPIFKDVDSLNANSQAVNVTQ